ncbi:MAG: PTS sugar transporter subunit IIA [Planctomycetaceae bacterium]|nr:PTS sugar transporter subunit IIA [Planctomycetaceae bacterium]
MPHTKMTLPQLVRYLHLPETQIKKLVSRGDIPSRRIDGELVFSRNDVNRWLEQKIGVSDNSELKEVEKALDKSSPDGSTDEDITIAGLIPEGAVAIPLQARTRDSAIREMIKLASSTGLLWDAEIMFEAVRAREELHSTALDNGIALLHSRQPLPNILGDTFISLGILPSGIAFGGNFGGITDILFLICSIDDRIHLRILTRLSRLLKLDGFIEGLREQETEKGIRKWIQQNEQRLAGGS